MPFPKMGFLDNLKDLVTKGPAGVANERLKEGLAKSDEINQLDRSDPEAMKAWTARQNAAVYGELNKHPMTRNVISAENMAHIEQLQNQALQNQAEFYQMLEEQRARKAAEAAANTPPPLPGEDR